MKTSPYIDAIQRAFSDGFSIAILDGFPKAVLTRVLDEFDCVLEKQSFLTECVGNEFGRTWSTRMYKALMPEKRWILNLAQFIRLREYFNEELFHEDACIVTESLRVAFPLRSRDFLEEMKEGTTNERSEVMPAHHVEHVKSGSKHYFIQGYSSSLKIERVFHEDQDFESSTNHECIEVDVSADTNELELVLCDLIESGSTTSQWIKVVASPKHDIGENVLSRLRKLQAAQININVVFEPKHKNINTALASSRAIGMLKQYWGDDAEFRNIRVYADPDVSRSTMEISQGQVVDTIIQEIDRGRNDEMPRDIFLTAPTGAGKSLLFQLPAFYASNVGDVTIVVSPLIALMKDQVSAVQNDRNFSKISYLNSELSFFDRKKILNQVHCGEIDVLYLSPELLLSYRVDHFIGDRNLGLVVIDEAHLITTWGRDFRVDYWFLGNHLRKLKKFNELKFPLVAVTATAVYGGTNDMVFDTLNSLEMNNPHIFIGVVRRDDIRFAIRNTLPEKMGKKQEAWKLNQTVDFIQALQSKTELKALVYAPYTKHVREIHKLAEERAPNTTVVYHGSLDPDEKSHSFERFLTGKVNTMICTKAFGMGIDISDIQLVYHHAPSGQLADYIQEIGRVARKSDLRGWAALDYSEQDKSYMKVLFGISSLKSHELKGVIKKLHDTWRQKKSRNMLISVDDFGHLFERMDARNLNQKVLTALMMIEKDYLQKYRFNVIVARPKALFVHVFARIPVSSWMEMNRSYGKCIEEINYTILNEKGFKVLRIDLDSLWQHHFQSEDFPTLKYKFYSSQLFAENLEVVPELRLELALEKEQSVALRSFQKVIDAMTMTFDGFGGVFFFAHELEERLREQLGSKSGSKLSKFILGLYESGFDTLTGKQADTTAFLAGRGVGSDRKYRFISKVFRAEFAQLKKQLAQLFQNESHIVRYRQINDVGAQRLFRLGQWLDVLKLGSFSATGGENPMIFIRVNDPAKLEKDVNRDHYRNILLDRTRDKHDVSVKIFDHFFQKSLIDSKRWDFVEDFFLGMGIDELFEKYPGEPGVNDIDIIETLSTTMLDDIQKERPVASPIVGNESQSGYYGLKDTVTLHWRGRLISRTVSKWITEDDLAFHKECERLGIRFKGEANRILFSRLKKHHDYFTNWIGSSKIVEIPKVGGKKPAKILLTNYPVEFYTWWQKNRQEVALTLIERIQLIDRVRAAGGQIAQVDIEWLNSSKK